ncbi:ryncolin-1-like [Strongylocentrotus purpuratus]|uniref:Fibrinogen C-terminal domain-containing protein n=1 Tax=Strongylocentrotus purpuratus TaxID=7668 RepID=A0A7M7T0Y3_STRPU|nr:ryncolin-1-like [Strongylocentrotus purpuratus]
MSTIIPAEMTQVTATDVPRLPRDCAEIQTGGPSHLSGVYPIYPDGVSDEPLFVYCDMETDGGRWTVFQRRQDGSVDFYLYWSDYKYGFGNVSSEHWLGNDNIHRLSRNKTYELRIDLEDFDGQTRYATYSNFSIADEVAKYILALDKYSGDAGDSMSFHAGYSFSTRDRDHDDAAGHCAGYYKGGWWYNKCHRANLNGLYLNGPTTQEEKAKGVVWDVWLGHLYSLKKTEMKLRPT